ncbi:MAG: hypothetical protein UV51_C0007G0013 [Candidatus Woesebacteria bacterium GW2011_GWC1_42_9]|nr:MAG: hypothetical protein UV51_C0007G0013 [Candidatus Woesebacteria bacterium GW2011_GWC1_42_9]
MKFKFSEIPKFCISIPRCTDRRAEVQKEFDKHNLSVVFYDAFDKQELVVPELSVKIHEKNANGILGCLLSHVSLIKEARRLHLPAICIFEDDVVFCDDFGERIKYIESTNIDFEIFILGGHFNSRHDNGNPTGVDRIRRVDHSGGTYGYIITESAYDYILRNVTYNYGMDQFYSDYVYRRFRTFAFIPFLCGCAKNKSEITGDVWAYENIEWHFTKEAIPKMNPVSQIKMPETFEVKKVEDRISFRHDLSEITFVIPFFIDSKEREENLLHVVKFLTKNFKTNILLVEESEMVTMNIHRLGNPDVKTIFIKRSMDLFNRTKVINDGIMECKTPYISVYDTDVIFYVDNYVNSYQHLRSGSAMVYPYSGKFVDIDRSYIADGVIREANTYGTDSYGGAFFANRDKYMEAGMENENIIGWGAEDAERRSRMAKLGHQIVRIPGTCWHISHPRGINSSTANPFWASNEKEYYKVDSMTKEELEKYISTWKWKK